MIQRIDGRKPDELRPIRMQLGFLETAEGSCWIEYGKTRVLCTASFQDTLPNWKTDSTGWVTAEYGMLPKSSKTRISREINKPKGRTAEIQRLIGRAIRAVTDFEALGNRMVNIDCDVIQADGGTRTAAVTGAMLAFWEACYLMSTAGVFQYWPIRERIAAVSVGKVQGLSLLDLCYNEDSIAEVDMNVVLTETGKIVEIQGTAESSPFSHEDLDQMLSLASGGIRELLAKQAEMIQHLVPPVSLRKF